MKKRTLQQAKDLLILWHILRISFFENVELGFKPCICGLTLDIVKDLAFTQNDRIAIKEDMYRQSLEFFSPIFRVEVKRGRKFGSSSFLFDSHKSRLKFINARIERLKAEILKLQSNE